VVVATAGDDDGGGLVKVGKAHEGMGGPPDEERLVDAVAEPGEDGREEEEEQILHERRHIGEWRRLVGERD
jgi:hypothetical protein